MNEQKHKSPVINFTKAVKTTLSFVYFKAFLNRSTELTHLLFFFLFLLFQAVFILLDNITDYPFAIGKKHSLEILLVIILPRVCATMKYLEHYN